jgi:hypothetical protein
MGAKLSPAAFFSYVRKDDQYERLSRLREALSDEVRLLTYLHFSDSGADAGIFQKSALPERSRDVPGAGTQARAE